MKLDKDIFNRFIDFALKMLFCFGLVRLSALFKMSFVFGSMRGFLSGSAATMPLLGMFGGGPVGLSVFSLSIIVRYLLFGAASLSILAFYVPGFCAFLYFSYKNVVTRLLIPLACMILFILHPVGSQAFLYSFFWLIPIAIYFVKSKNLFLHALASTFIAHAVGSVIWLYTVQMNAAVWYSLIPIVILERIAIACAIFVSAGVVHFLKNKYLHSQEKKAKICVTS